MITPQQFVARIAADGTEGMVGVRDPAVATGNGYERVLMQGAEQIVVFTARGREALLPLIDPGYVVPRCMESTYLTLDDIRGVYIVP
jgi:hypothetical protein